MTRDSRPSIGTPIKLVLYVICLALLGAIILYCIRWKVQQTMGDSRLRHREATQAIERDTFTSANMDAGRRKPTLNEPTSNGYRLNGSMRVVPDK